jgi:catechol 2,3-dioxygenase-like lactoylglutathione lyase family enzyme
VLSSFDHAVIAVRDLERASESTARLLGRPPSWRGSHPGAGTANTLFRLANGYIELLAPAGDGAVGRMLAAELEARGEGLVALAFATDDLAGFVADRRAHGLAMRDPEAGEGRGAAPPGAAVGVRRWSSAWFPAAATRGLPLFAIEHRSPPSALASQPPDGLPAAAISALDHVVVISDDPVASRDFFREGLGLRLALDREFERRGIRISFFRVGGVTIEVAGPRTPVANGGDDRFGGIAYQVADVAAARARLVDTGFDVSETRAGHKPGTGVCTVKSGTCGVPTLLIEPVKPEAA